MSRPCHACGAPAGDLAALCSGCADAVWDRRESRTALLSDRATRELEERREAVRVLGLGPEPLTGDPGERFAATTGELVRWAREARDGGVCALIGARPCRLAYGHAGPCVRS